MAEKKSETPLYDKHKKYHDLVGRLKDLSDDEHTTGLASDVHKIASEYLHKNKGLDGKLHWSDHKEKAEEKHKDFTDSLWDAAADRIAKHYLHLTDTQIKDLKKAKKTPDGESPWENMISQYLGGMSKDDFFERVKTEDELTIESILRTYVHTLSSRHTNYRHTTLLKEHIKKPEDLDGVAAYLSNAKKHNKKALRPMRIPKKFLSREDAMNTLSTASQYIDRQYHPDKKETYN